MRVHEVCLLQLSKFREEFLISNVFLLHEHLGPVRRYELATQVFELHTIGRGFLWTS